MKIQRQCKSLKVVLPKDVADAFDMKAGDQIEWRSNQWQQLMLIKIVPGGKLMTAYNPVQRQPLPLPEDVTR